MDTQADIQKLPFADQSFDLIICCHVLEHILDDRAAMQELRRICSRAGFALIQVPIDGQETREDLSNIDRALRRKLFGEFDHWRSYGLDIASKLASVGFDVRTLDVARDIPNAVRALHGLAAEHVFVCRPIRD